MERLKLRPVVVAWSDGRGADQARALADKYAYLLPGRITNAQLSGLNGLVQAATRLGQVSEFTQHQAQRAARAGRLDVRDYWDALGQALRVLEDEASRLAAQTGVELTSSPARGKGTPKALDWLALWLAQEFVQHLVAHSLYLGVSSKPKDSNKARN